MKKFLLGLAIFLAFGVALYGWSYVFIASMAENNGTMSHHLADRPIAMYLHVIFGPLALLIGGFQFYPGWRSKHPAYHRLAGRVYVGSMSLSGVGASVMALTTNSGPVAAAGFGGLAIASIFTTVRGYLLARAGRYELHRRWMIRSYVLAFAAVTLRLQLAPLVMGVWTDFATGYVIISWSCWVPNLLYGEWYVRKYAAIPK
ncbi:MAG: DUF2306 domain-containing protein [Kordiimonadaceae bacterium]|nr:DUF2306 domain-containing protein [Kordiimonadaceae bacterium]